MSKESKEDLKLVWRIARNVVAGILLFVGIIWFIAYLFTLGERPLIDLHRENVQHSQEYIESQVQRLQNLHTEYLSLEAKIASSQGQTELVGALQAQQKAILNQMHEIADLIPESEIPKGITTFLNDHQQ